MQPGHDLSQLVDRIRESNEPSGAPPFILVVGERCAVAAKVPPLDELRSKYGDAVDDPDLLETVVNGISVPPFYLDLANLARAGMFPTIVTTGYDRLLESALTVAGLRQGDQYSVYDLHEGRGSVMGVRPSPIRIVRTWGIADAERGAKLIGMATGTEAGVPLRLVIVGYGDESDAVDSWIRDAGGGELWWVHDAESPDRLLAAARWTGEVAPISGPDSEPPTFFGQLALVLLRIPTVDALEIGAPTEQRGDDWYETQLNQSRLYTAKAVKRGLDSFSTAAPDSVAQTQLSYQRDEIDRLEQSLAASSVMALRDRYIETASQLDAIRSRDPARVDQDTIDLVTATINSLEREAAKPSPSRAVVAAAGASLEAIQASVGIRPPATAS